MGRKSESEIMAKRGVRKESLRRAKLRSRLCEAVERGDVQFTPWELWYALDIFGLQEIEKC